jgi:hypothetical protein
VHAAAVCGSAIPLDAPDNGDDSLIQIKLRIYAAHLTNLNVACTINVNVA